MADPLKLLQEYAMGGCEFRELEHVKILYYKFCYKFFRMVHVIMCFEMWPFYMMAKLILVFIISQMNFIQLKQF